MKQTENFFLKLFEGTDRFDYKVVNENWQKIDDAIDELLNGGNMAVLPTMTIERTEKGYHITTNDAKGSQTFEIFNGKTAYQYALDGGYTGTEEEFAANIALGGAVGNELAVQRARIDNLSSLEEGSTTGDAELADARVDKDGNIYENVGEHIRSVTGELSQEKVDKNGVNQVTAENASFIEKTTSAQMLDLSSFERGKKVSDTYGDDITNLVDNEYYSTSNIIDFDDENRKTIAININKNFSVYGYLKSGDSYVRHAMVGPTNFTQVGDHWEYTFPNNIVKLRLGIQNGILATVESTLLMTYADEWNSADLEYGTKYKLAETIRTYEPFESKNFCGIGDSIMQGSGDAVGGFLGVLQEQYPSISVHNMGVGSTTMAQNASVPANASNKCILDRIDDIPDGQDYIILEGGLNDFFHSSTYSIPFGEYESNINMIPQNARWNETAKAYANLTTLYSYGMGQSATLDTTTFCGAFEAALVKLVIRFYDKKYGVVIPHNPRSTVDIDAYLDAEVRLCEKYGVPCLDLRRVAGMPRIHVIAGKTDGTSVFTMDAGHPNYEGYRLRYLPPLIAWLRTL